VQKVEKVEQKVVVEKKMQEAAQKVKKDNQKKIQQPVAAAE